MKLPSPYKCDYCPNVKGEANRWFLRVPQTVVNSEGEMTYRYTTDGYVLIAWHEEMAAAMPGVEHICGQECAAKALAKWMAAQ